MATIPFDMEVEAYFLAKEDGIVAGIALADMIFEQVDPSLKVSSLLLNLCYSSQFEWVGFVFNVYLFLVVESQVEWMRTDGDYVHKGLKFGKVSGNAHKIVVAERVVLNFMQRMSGIATLTKVFLSI